MRAPPSAAMSSESKHRLCTASGRLRHGPRHSEETGEGGAQCDTITECRFASLRSLTARLPKQRRHRAALKDRGMLGKRPVGSSVRIAHRRQMLTKLRSKPSKIHSCLGQEIDTLLQQEIV